MKISKFISFTVIGMVIWDTILIYIGYTLGTRWNSILGISNNLTYAALAVLRNSRQLICYIHVRRILVYIGKRFPDVLFELVWNFEGQH